MFAKLKKCIFETLYQDLDGKSISKVPYYTE